MQSITITGSQRESVGKVSTKALRNAGKVPCVLYGGDKNIHFSADELAFRKLVYTPNVYTATIEVGGDKFTAILKDIQYHPVTDRILHIDFYQLFDDREITMEIPFRLIGVPKGVVIGGVLRHNLRKLKVRALPANLPDFIEYDVTELEIGDKLYVTKLPTGDFTIVHPENTVVAQVRMSRNAVLADEDEAPAADDAPAADAPAE